MKFTIDISDKRITDLLHGHGGHYSPWLHELSGKWNSKAGAKAKFDREQDDEGSNKGSLTIRSGQVKRGMAIFAMLPSFGDFICENDDDLTFDCAMQCIIFGKLVYA